MCFFTVGGKSAPDQYTFRTDRVMPSSPVAANEYNLHKVTTDPASCYKDVFQMRSDHELITK